MNRKIYKLYWQIDKLMSAEEKFVKTTLKIREDIFLKGKLLASTRGVTFSEILNEALEAYLKEHEDEIKKKFAEVMQWIQIITP